MPDVSPSKLFRLFSVYSAAYSCCIANRAHVEHYCGCNLSECTATAATVLVAVCRPSAASSSKSSSQTVPMQTQSEAWFERSWRR